MKPETKLKKEIEVTEMHLNHLLKYYSKGWDIYFGEPISPQIRETRNDLKALKVQLSQQPVGNKVQ